jgi:hypothetical protein
MPGQSPQAPPQQAEAIARWITSPEWQANALAEVAETLTRAAAADAAARVTAALCAIGEWPTAVPPVLLLVPSVFTALVAQTLEEQEKQ